MKAKAIRILFSSLMMVATMQLAGSCRLFRQAPPRPVERDYEIVRQDTPVRPLEPKPLPAPKAVDTLLLVYPQVINPYYTIRIIAPFGNGGLPVQGNALASAEFLKGAMLAADTLQRCGTRIRLDVVNSSAAAYSPFSQLRSETHPDLIIGELMKDDTALASIAHRHRVNVVQPLGMRDRCDTLPYYAVSSPGYFELGLQTRRAVDSLYPYYPVYYFYDLKSEEDDFVKGMLHAEASMQNKAARLSLKARDTTVHDSAVIIVPTREENEVIPVINQLRKQPEKKFIVFGLPTWQHFNYFEAEVWERYHCHLVSNYHIDYTDYHTLRFIDRFRATYNAEPGPWAFYGYDETMFYGSLLGQYGRYFQYYSDQATWKGLHNDYRLSSACGIGSLHNRATRLLIFQNYRLKIAGN